MVSTLLFVVALLTGMQVIGGGVDLFGLVVLAALVNLTATFFAADVAFRTRTIQAGPAMQMPVFIILFLAPVYVPLDLLKGWIEVVATLNPITRVLETGRGLLAGSPPHVLHTYGLAAGLAAVFLVWAMRGLRSAEAAG